MAGDQQIDFLPNRLNRQAVIFRGMTNSELFTVAGIGGVAGFVLGLIVAMLLSDWIWIPSFMLLMPLFAVISGGKIIARFKRGKPETWLLRHLEWRKATFFHHAKVIHAKSEAPWYWSIRRQQRQRGRVK